MNVRKIQVRDSICLSSRTFGFFLVILMIAVLTLFSLLNFNFSCLLMEECAREIIFRTFPCSLLYVLM